MALGGWSLGFPLGRLQRSIESGSSQFLPLDSGVTIERSWFAVGTGVSKVLPVRVPVIVGIEAFNVLPRIASIAVYRVPVIVSEVANTLDSVRFFIDHLDFTRHMAQ
jgi:hypothetical protein